MAFKSNNNIGYSKDGLPYLWGSGDDTTVTSVANSSLNGNTEVILPIQPYDIDDPEEDTLHPGTMYSFGRGAALARIPSIGYTGANNATSLYNSNVVQNDLYAYVGYNQTTSPYGTNARVVKVKVTEPGSNLDFTGAYANQVPASLSTFSDFGNNIIIAEDRVLIKDQWGDVGRQGSIESFNLDLSDQKTFHWQPAYMGFVANASSNGLGFAYLGDVVVFGSGRDYKIVVGDPYDNANTGAVHIFSMNTASAYSLSHIKITASDGSPGDKFGSCVNIDRDTNSTDRKIVVGAYAANSNLGRAYIYDTSGANEVVIDPTTATGDTGSIQFGWSVAAGNNRIAVGAPYYNSQEGKVYLFYSNGEFIDSAKATNALSLSGSSSTSLANTSRMGETLAMHDGTIVAGAPYYNANGTHSDTGALAAFDYNLDRTWRVVKCDPSSSQVWRNDAVTGSSRLGFRGLDIKGNYVAAATYGGDPNVVFVFAANTAEANATPIHAIYGEYVTGYRLGLDEKYQSYNTSNYFGNPVAIEDNGDLYITDENTRIFVYNVGGANVVYKGVIDPSTRNKDQHGKSVGNHGHRMSVDHELLVVSSSSPSLPDVYNDEEGRVLVYQAAVTPYINSYYKDNSQDYFGEVQEYYDGFVYIGSPYFQRGISMTGYDTSSTYWSKGRVSIYHANGCFYREVDHGTAFDTDYLSENFGSDIAVGSNKLVIGAYRHDYNGIANTGAFYIYDTHGQGPSRRIVPDNPLANSWIGNTGTLAVGSGLIAAGCPNHDKVYVFNLYGKQLFELDNPISSYTYGRYGYETLIANGRIYVLANIAEGSYPFTLHNVFVYTLTGDYLGSIRGIRGADQMARGTKVGGSKDPVDHAQHSNQYYGAINLSAFEDMIYFGDPIRYYEGRSTSSLYTLPGGMTIVKGQPRIYTPHELHDSSKRYK